MGEGETSRDEIDRMKNIENAAEHPESGGIQDAACIHPYLFLIMVFYHALLYQALFCQALFYQKFFLCIFLCSHLLVLCPNDSVNLSNIKSER